MAPETVDLVKIVAFSTKTDAIIWSETDGSLCRIRVAKRVPVSSRVPPDVMLCAAKTLVCTTNPVISRKSIICALRYIVKNDPCSWVRLRGSAALGLVRALNTIPRAHIPESVADADRGRYIALSYLIPLEFSGPAAVSRVCLRTVCPHVYDILLCLKNTPLPKELHLFILNYL